jgi:hypothetical protein
VHTAAAPWHGLPLTLRAHPFAPTPARAVGIKMAMEYFHLGVSSAVSLGVIVGLLAVGTVASLLHNRVPSPSHPAAEASSAPSALQGEPASPEPRQKFQWAREDPDAPPAFEGGAKSAAPPAPRLYRRGVWQNHLEDTFAFDTIEPSDKAMRTAASQASEPASPAKASELKTPPRAKDVIEAVDSGMME